MSAPYNPSKCACVHPDAYECAWIRDGRPNDEDDARKRACECDCHKDEEDEEPIWERDMGRIK